MGLKPRRVSSQGSHHATATCRPISDLASPGAVCIPPFRGGTYAPHQQCQPGESMDRLGEGLSSRRPKSLPIPTPPTATGPWSGRRKPWKSTPSPRKEPLYKQLLEHLPLARQRRKRSSTLQETHGSPGQRTSR